MTLRNNIVFLLFSLFTLWFSYWLGSDFDYQGFYLTHWEYAWNSTPYHLENRENTYPPAFFFLMVFWKLHPLLPKLLFVACGLVMQWICVDQFFRSQQTISRQKPIWPWVTATTISIHFFIFTVDFGCADAFLGLLIFLTIISLQLNKVFFSGFILAVAGMIKFYPFFLLPIFLKEKKMRIPTLLGLFTGLTLITGISTWLWKDSWLLFFQTAINYEAEFASLPAAFEQIFQLSGNFQYLYHLFFLLHLSLAVIVIWLKDLDYYFSSFLLLAVAFATFTMGHIQFLVVPLFLVLMYFAKNYYAFSIKQKWIVGIYYAWINLIALIYFLERHDISTILFLPFRFRDFVGVGQYMITMGTAYFLLKNPSKILSS